MPNLNTCLITGLPGSGKTLYVMEQLVKNSKLPDDQRRVIYTNIDGIDHDALKTKPLPELSELTLESHEQGAVFVIDEAQAHGYSPQPATKKKPTWIQLLQVRRHAGYDFILITQHPKLIDSDCRRLLADHYHCYRPFGVRYRVVSHWPTVNENPEPSQSADTAVKTKMRFNKDIFKYYKSATVHTQKMNLPIGKFALVGVCLAISVGGIGYVLYSKFSKSEPAETSVKASSAVSAVDYSASYAGHMLVVRNGQKMADVLFNKNGDTYQLYDFSYSFRNKVLIVYDEFGKVFAEFEVPTDIKGYL